MKEYELIDNVEENRYEFRVDKYIPKIEYIKRGNVEIYLTHTEVPPALEGQGIATQMVQKVLADIEEKGLSLIPLCPFVIGYIKRNPEWKRIVMDGINI